ncbi:hypothetical protein N781_05720 [Pontibacillus halophilus JSM 076056 = DSM 19796]|uniref:Sulfatase N-terminal domain-containing protein n=1 Tax=Pontibacillus halophilus JSM 076056 = DSM 19796 TaxID=1385510 RepID=A0A0A5GIB6_9BACI|nr:LTA synthase family protein [Pontibacillus halophilus]KGX90870.1 hypothetical protein N781_05720 [Pontibacillus halophilus JSM 076056 = DSM 19796]
MPQKRNLPLYLVASVLFGIKSYILYRFVFKLSMENGLQELILLINPFATALLFFMFAVWFKPEKQVKYIRRISLVLTLILYFNLLFYRNFTDFLTFPLLFQSSNMSDLGSSIMGLIHGPDLLLFVDVVLVYYLSKRVNWSAQPMFRQTRTAITGLAFALLMVNVALAETERPMLFTRTFDREYLVKNIGVFNYHIYDAVLQSKSKTQRVFADGSEIQEIDQYIDNQASADGESELAGVAKDKNVIYISAESLQTFVLGKEVNGKEITPFLNDLMKDSYYFENFYHQTGQGKTSDSEFIIENSLYPLSRGSVFFTNAQNEYNAVPEILSEYGYTSAVLHANNGSFWNRNVMYESLGYDEFFTEDAYTVNEENSIGWGLDDKAFFDQSVDKLKQLEEPYYAKLITLTNHFPFEMPEEQKSIDELQTGSETLNNYVTTVRYMDEAIQQFFEKLKESGEYEDSVIVIYGDHYGISENHDTATAEFLGKETITPYDHVQLQRVPLFVHVPGHDGEVKSEVSGQIDLKPTVLSMLGVQNNEDITFGTDLFSEDRKEFIALRNGSFVSKDHVYTGGTCYDRETGEVVAEGCQPIKEKVEQELNYSDSIIYGDLFRFFQFEHEEMPKE